MSRLILPGSPINIGRGSLVNIDNTAQAGWTHAKSVNFDGSATALTVSSAINVGGSTARTWTWWIKFTSVAATENIVNTTDGTRNQYIYFDKAHGSPTGVIAIDWFDATHEIFGYQTAGTLTSGGWNHIAVVNSGTDLMTGFTIYINGSSVAQTNQLNQSGGSYQSTGSYLIGKNGPGITAYFAGRMNMHAIYSYAASASDITAMYNSGATIDLSTLASYTNIVAWYQMGNYATDTTSTIVNSANPGTYDATGTSVTIVTDSP